MDIDFETFKRMMKSYVYGLQKGISLENNKLDINGVRRVEITLNMGKHFMGGTSDIHFVHTKIDNPKVKCEINDRRIQITLIRPGDFENFIFNLNKDIKEKDDGEYENKLSGNHSYLKLEFK